MNSLLTELPRLLQGTEQTILLALAALIIGFSLAMAMTIGKILGNWPLRKVINGVIIFVCGTPLLVQIFLIYYGASQFEWIRASPLWFIVREPFACAILAFSLNTACYTAVLLSGAINSVPKNEIAAAYALGMSESQILKRILLPQALRLFLPAYSNEMIIIVKNTALASTITILDLMGVTQLLIAETYQTVSWYLIAGIIYLILNAFMLLLYQAIRKLTFIPITQQR